MSPINLDISHATPEQITEIINYLKGNPSKVAVPQRKVTHVAFVLDESGSMEICRDATIEGFNSALRELKNAPADSGEYFLTLVKVNGIATVVYRSMPITDAKPLSRETYCPGAGTPLYDGIGSAITVLESRTVTLNVNAAFLVSIFTDGQETGSYHWTGPNLSKKIVQKQGTGLWTFVVTGANISLTDLSQKLSIPMNNMQMYTSTPRGTQEAWSNQVQAQNSYSQLRSMGATNSNSFFGGTNPQQFTQAIDPALLQTQFPPKTAEQAKIEEDMKNAQFTQQNLITRSHSHS